MTKRRVAVWASIALIPVVIGVALAALDVVRQNGAYIVTKDAQVMAPMLQVPAPLAGQVTQMMVEVGDIVEPGAHLATLIASTSAAASAATGTSTLNRFGVNVRAPVAGTVLTVSSTVGASVNAGQLLVTIGDLDSVWVLATVDETRIAQVHAGQTAGVRIQGLDWNVAGQVAQVEPVTTGAVSANTGTRQGASTSSTGTRPTQSVPVRIALRPGSQPEGNQRRLVPGMSAEVRINLR